MRRTLRSSCLIAVAVVLSLAVVTAASAKGNTPEQLTAAGWTCFNDPGHGRPQVPPPVDRPPSYNFKIFALDGSFTGTIHLIRSDLYNGQPCPQTGGL